MPIAWTDIENAIHAWVVSGTGLAPDKVVWEHQKIPQRPSFATLKILAIVPVGWDQLRQSTDLLAPAGQEITFTVKGIRRITVSVQAFSSAVTGANTARALIEKANTALVLPPVEDALRVAGLVWVNQGRITDVSALLETEWQSRAALTVEFYVVDSAEAKTTYIETVDVQGTT